LESEREDAKRSHDGETCVENANKDSHPDNENHDALSRVASTRLLTANSDRRSSVHAKGMLVDLTHVDPVSSHFRCLCFEPIKQ